MNSRNQVHYSTLQEFSMGSTASGAWNFFLWKLVISMEFRKNHTQNQCMSTCKSLCTCKQSLVLTSFHGFYEFPLFFMKVHIAPYARRVVYYVLPQIQNITHNQIRESALKIATTPKPGKNSTEKYENHFVEHLKLC